MKRHLSLLKILKEIYDRPGGDGEEILHKDLMPHIKNMPGTEQIQKWLDDKGSVPEYLIPRWVTDPQSLRKLKALIPQLKQQKLERFRNPQLQKDWNPYAAKENEIAKNEVAQENLADLVYEILMQDKSGNGYSIKDIRNIAKREKRTSLSLQEIYDILSELKSQNKIGSYSNDTYDIYFA